ncbi:hypothetical protein V6N13_122538 [Hibiscus sabdariffa]
MGTRTYYVPLLAKVARTPILAHYRLANWFGSRECTTKRRGGLLTNQMVWDSGSELPTRGGLLTKVYGISLPLKGWSSGIELEDNDATHVGGPL